MLEAVINVSEGRDESVIAAIAEAGGDHTLDVHRDPDHHRAVLTLAGPAVEAAALSVVTAAVARLDLRGHHGAHPRLGVADVVPFVPLAGAGLAEAAGARDRVAGAIAADLAVPCFLYGEERTLPEVRSTAFVTLAPDIGPAVPHPTAGACCVGARRVLVAYNVWLASPATVADAKAVARTIRGPAVRALGFDLAGRPQVSCNLVDPAAVGPGQVVDAVARLAPVAGTELVGLVPAAVLHAEPRHRWAELDLDPAKTIEARLEEAGLRSG